MIDGLTAFSDFQRCVTDLADWGYDVRIQDDFGEFELNGFVCTYRFFDVLDIQFLKPGETLRANHEPDVILTWDGNGWRDVTMGEPGAQLLSTRELFWWCARVVNYLVTVPGGFDPYYVMLANTGFLENQTSG